MQKWHRWQDWTNLVAGAWLFITPWLFSNPSSAAWDAWLLGAAIVVIAIWALSVPESKGAEWTNAVFGAWVFLAPWILSFAGSAGAAWNAWIVGAVVAIAALWAVTELGSSTSTISHGTPQHT